MPWRRIVALVATWAALAFLVSLAWELAQARLYTLWAANDGPWIATALLHRSLGDTGIALAMYTLAALLLWRADWPVSRPWTGCVVVMTGAVALTVASEWYNVYRSGSWAYTASMPLVHGIGLTPLLQWLVVPPVLTAVSRTFMPAGGDRRRTPLPFAAYKVARG